MLGNCKVYMKAGHCSTTTYRQKSIPVNKIASKKSARCLALPANQPHMLLQGLRYNVISLPNRQANRLLLVRAQHRGLAVFVRGRAIQLCNNWKEVCAAVAWSEQQLMSSLNQLPYNCACKSDKPTSLFPPTDGTFQQYTRCVDHQVALWIHSLEANPYFEILMAMDGR